MGWQIKGGLVVAAPRVIQNYLSLYSNNNIRKISPSVVSRNRNKLTYLDVSTNRLERVKRNTFARLTHLATLDLHANVIKYVSSDAFNRNRSADMLFWSKCDNRMKKYLKQLWSILTSSGGTRMRTLQRGTATTQQSWLLFTFVGHVK